MDVAGRKFSPQTIKILELRRCGMKQAEIADSIGCSLDSVRNACKYMPLEKKKKLTEEDARAIIDKAGYDYVEGFVNAHSKVIIKCRECGGTFEKMYKHLHSKAHGTYKSIMKCPHCLQSEKEIIKRKQDEERTDRMKKAEHEAQEVAKRKADRLSRKIGNETTKRLAIHVCKNCGVEFCQMVTGYNSEIYCSERCQIRWLNRTRSEKRYKTLMSRRHDNSISLERLFKRDKGICYLCGELCDWNDGYFKDETFVAGNNYPSVDHVIPVTRGGTHTWDNIRLAHRICNTIKRDS